MTTIKLNVNSAISDIKSRYMSMDVKYFYLNNNMDKAEHIIIQMYMTAQAFVNKYNLNNKVNNR